MRLVKATIHDLNTIYYILRDGRQQLADLGINQWQSTYPSVKQIVADIEDGTAWLYQDENYEIVGTAVLKTSSDQIYRQTTANWPMTITHYATIHRLVIHSAHTRKGHASRLLSLMINESMVHHEEAQSIRIHIHCDNVPMQSLFTKLNFVKVDEIANTDHQQSYIYEKLLPMVVG